MKNNYVALFVIKILIKNKKALMSREAVSNYQDNALEMLVDDISQSTEDCEKIDHTKWSYFIDNKKKSKIFIQTLERFKKE